MERTYPGRARERSAFTPGDVKLPAVLTSAKIALLSHTCALRSLSPLRRPCFIHHQRPPHQRPSVTCLNSLSREHIIVDFYEPGTPAPRR